MVEMDRCHYHSFGVLLLRTQRSCQTFRRGSFAQKTDVTAGFHVLRAPVQADPASRSLPSSRFGNKRNVQTCISQVR